LLIFTKFPQNRTATNSNPAALRNWTHTDLSCHAFDDDIVSFSSRGIPVTHSQSSDSSYDRKRNNKQEDRLAENSTVENNEEIIEVLIILCINTF
jgi:hypothetical protein